MENLAGGFHEKAGFNGVWLYADKGRIVSKGVSGFLDSEDAEFIVDEVNINDGELYAKGIDDEDEPEFRLYPLGEDKFGRKDDMIEITFENGCVTYNDDTCKKL